MPAKTIKVCASGGGEFDCCLATSAGNGKVPAVVLASAMHGVDLDVQGIADAFAARVHATKDKERGNCRAVL